MKRTRREALAGAVLLMALAGAAVGIDEIVWRGAHAAAAAAAVSDAVMDPGSIFAARSPGARDGGFLLQTKPDRVAAAQVKPEGPEERVLAGVRERPPEPELALDGSPLSLIQAPPELAIGAPPAGGNLPAPLGFSGPGFSPLAGPLTPPNAQSTPPGGLPPDTPQTPANPVPEPDVWMLMILALFAVGAALRWKRSHRATPGFNA